MSTFIYVLLCIIVSEIVVLINKERIKPLFKPKTKIGGTVLTITIGVILSACVFMVVDGEKHPIITGLLLGMDYGLAQILVRTKE